MKNDEIKDFFEILYPLFRDRLLRDGTLKSYTQIKTATVVSELSQDKTNIGKEVDVTFPYDSTPFSVRNETGENLQKGDNVSLLQWIDLKNSVAIFKIRNI